MFALCTFPRFGVLGSRAAVTPRLCADGCHGRRTCDARRGATIGPDPAFLSIAWLCTDPRHRARAHIHTQAQTGTFGFAPSCTLVRFLSLAKRLRDALYMPSTTTTNSLACSVAHASEESEREREMKAPETPHARPSAGWRAACGALASQSEPLAARRWSGDALGAAEVEATPALTLARTHNQPQVQAWTR